MRGAIAAEEESTLEYQTEVDVEFHVEEEQAAEIKNQVQTVKNSPEAQQHQAAIALKEVAEMQQECRDSVKVFKLKRAQELTRTQREDGKQDAWNGHAQAASQAKAAPEEHGPDAERQEVGREEQELLTRHCPKNSKQFSSRSRR